MAARQAPLSFTISQSLLKLRYIESMMPSNHLISCYPLLLLPSIFPSVRVFPSESALRIKWPKCLSFSISPSNEYSELIVIKIDWFDLIAVQGATQFERINSLVLSLHYDRILQLYLTIEKIIALTILTFVGKMMSLLFNILSNSKKR